MNPKEYDIELSDEVIRSQKLGEVTDEIKEIFINFIWSTSELKKYSKLSENDLSLCEAFALKKCCDEVLTVDIEKDDKLYLYFNQLIKSSYATTIRRLNVTKKQLVENES